MPQLQLIASIFVDCLAFLIIFLLEKFLCKLQQINEIRFLQITNKKKMKSWKRLFSKRKQAFKGWFIHSEKFILRTRVFSRFAESFICLFQRTQKPFSLCFQISKNLNFPNIILSNLFRKCFIAHPTETPTVKTSTSRTVI